MSRIGRATAGLFVAWCAHDLEELLTMSATTRALFPDLPDWVPLPNGAREHGLTTRYVATGIGTVGLIIAAASVRGYRTTGRSAVYQTTLLAFGLHGIGHVAISVAAGRYASGVVTSPTIVVPFWLWATRTLDRAGVPHRRRVPAALAVFAGAVGTGHLVAYLVTGNRP
jgi:Protein of unknown function with HXXEE motif